ncbi:hypothetical protein U9M48_015202 [Paspalum notatum var. saurae]|uniref:Uncharacterized protein n=1 Tax=Paspalum notatum var. saurae TaxID=547442 RepID=A0AAQ3T605_PASNO
MPSILLRASLVVSIVIEDEEEHASRICSSSSTLEAGLEGRLIDLWCYWQQESTGRLQNSMMISRSSKRRMPIEMDQGCIYKLRVLRRETLLWINFLNKVSTPPSRSTMTNSISCSCSSSHITLLLWKVLETKDHLLELGAEIHRGFKHGDCNLSGFSQLLDHPAAVLVNCSRLLDDLLELFLHLLNQADIRLHLGLKNRVISSSLDDQLHLLDACLECRKVLLHGVAEVKHDEGVLKLLLHRIPVLWPANADLAAW